MPGFENLSIAIVIWIVLVLAFSGVVQGALGLGFPTLATPLIAAVTDMRTAVILVLLPCVATTATNIANSGPILPVLRRFWFMPLCMIVGAATGARLFVTYPTFPYALLLAGVILFYLNLDRLGQAHWPMVQKHPALFGMLFGVIAGLSEGTANIAAPPLIMYFFSLGLDRLTFVQAINLCFTVGKPTQWVVLTVSGGVTMTQWAVTLPLAAMTVGTTLAGIRIRDRIAAETYRRWLKNFLFVVAMILLVQYGYTCWVG